MVTMLNKFFLGSGKTNQGFEKKEERPFGILIWMPLSGLTFETRAKIPPFGWQSHIWMLLQDHKPDHHHQSISSSLTTT